MKGLLDEQLSPQIAALLRQRAFDVEAVADRADLVGRSDLTVFEVACSEDRAVVANNVRDFRSLAAQWLAQGRVRAGLILLPSSRTRTRAAVTLLANRIATVMEDSPDGLASSERWTGPLPGA